MNALRMAVHLDKSDDSDVSERLMKLEQEIADVEETLEIKVARMKRLRRELGIASNEDSRRLEVDPPPRLRQERSPRSAGLFSSPLFNAVASLGYDISEMVLSQFGCQRRCTADTSRDVSSSSIRPHGRTPSREGLLHQASNSSNGQQPTKHRSFAEPSVMATLVAIEDTVDEDLRKSLNPSCKQTIQSNSTAVAFPSSIIGNADDTCQRL